MEENRSLTNCFDHRSEDPNPQRIRDIPKSAKEKQTSTNDNKRKNFQKRFHNSNSDQQSRINSLMKKKFYTPLL